MRSKDITLSASLMAVFILINVFSSISPIRIQSVLGLGVFDWTVEELGGIIDLRQYDLLVALAKLEIGPRFWIFCTSYLILACGLVPYLFYKYFKYVGVFKRLPSF